jgi:hypothetical protein
MNTSWQSKLFQTLLFQWPLGVLAKKKNKKSQSQSCYSQVSLSLALIQIFVKVLADAELLLLQNLTKGIDLGNWIRKINLTEMASSSR